ncbi:MAG: MFS transporter [Alphaproteobacteria bacterium]
MPKDKYISVRPSVNGFSFANLGLFTGFGDGVYNAVYSLVILEIFTGFLGEHFASAAVGVYVGIYSVFCMFIGLLANELFRWFTKARLLYISMFLLSVCYAFMSMSVKPLTFVTLDYMSGVCSTLVLVLIPLFMADFSKKIGMAKLNARYHLWQNIGALLAPMFAVTIATRFGSNRMAFLAAAMIYFSGLMFFKHFGVVQQDKEFKKVNPKRTLKSLWLNALAFFRYRGMARAYAVNFSFYALRAMRYLYVPIIVIESGFSKNTLGIVLTLGIIPYIVIDFFVGNLIKKYGSAVFLYLGFISFGALSFWATFAQGYSLLAIFVLWQISGAFIEPVHDLLFFDNTQPAQRSRFYGIFRTGANFPNVVAPMLGAVCIALIGTTSSVWFVTTGICLFAVLILLFGKR